MYLGHWRYPYPNPDPDLSLCNKTYLKNKLVNPAYGNEGSKGSGSKCQKRKSLPNFNNLMLDT